MQNRAMWPCFLQRRQTMYFLCPSLGRRKTQRFCVAHYWTDGRTAPPGRPAAGVPGRKGLLLAPESAISSLFLFSVYAITSTSPKTYWPYHSHGNPLQATIPFSLLKYSHLSLSPSLLSSIPSSSQPFSLSPSSSRSSPQSHAGAGMQRFFTS